MIYFINSIENRDFKSSEKNPWQLNYCRMRLRGQNDKNLAIFGHFRKVGASKRTKRGVKIVVRKQINTHYNVAKFDFSISF